MGEDKSTQLDSLVDTYVQAAIVHRDATEKGRYRTVNRAADTLASARTELRALGPEGERRLLGLLEHEDLRVRGMAAADILDFAPARALPVLRSLAEEGGPAGFDARMVLKYKTRKE